MKTTKVPPKICKAASPNDILGLTRRVPVPAGLVEPQVCFSCLTKLANVRVAALRSLGTPFDRWTCVKCANMVTTPRLGIFMGEVGTSELKIVDRVYADTVRDVFMQPDDVVNSEKD